MSEIDAGIYLRQAKMFHCGTKGIPLSIIRINIAKPSNLIAVVEESRSGFPSGAEEKRSPYHAEIQSLNATAFCGRETKRADLTTLSGREENILSPCQS